MARAIAAVHVTAVCACGMRVAVATIFVQRAPVDVNAAPGRPANATAGTTGVARRACRAKKVAESVNACGKRVALWASCPSIPALINIQTYSVVRLCFVPSGIPAVTTIASVLVDAIGTRDVSWLHGIVGGAANDTGTFVDVRTADIAIAEVPVGTWTAGVTSICVRAAVAASVASALAKWVTSSVVGRTLIDVCASHSRTLVARWAAATRVITRSVGA